MRLVLFGTGMAANKLMKYSLRKENQIIAVVDNNSQKIGGKCGTYVIESPEILKEKTYDKVLVAVINGWMDVYNQLRGMGIPKSRIEVAVGWSRVDYYDDPLDEIFVIPKKPFVPFEKKPVTSLGHCAAKQGRRTPEGREKVSLANTAGERDSISAAAMILLCRAAPAGISSMVMHSTSMERRTQVSTSSTRPTVSSIWMMCALPSRIGSASCGPAGISSSMVRIVISMRNGASCHRGSTLITSICFSSARQSRRIHWIS